LVIPIKDIFWYQIIITNQDLTPNLLDLPKTLGTSPEKFEQEIRFLGAAKLY
jgi:hypothetical protein